MTLQNKSPYENDQCTCSFGSCVQQVSFKSYNNFSICTNKFNLFCFFIYSVIIAVHDLVLRAHNLEFFSKQLFRPVTHDLVVQIILVGHLKQQYCRSFTVYIEPPHGFSAYFMSTCLFSSLLSGPTFIKEICP